MTASLSIHHPDEQPIPLIDLTAQFQTMSTEILAAVEKVFTEQKFILGDEVAELEKEIAQYSDARHAIGCNSGTDALILALQAMNIGPGDEVITTPFSFFATASAICRVGATPVFVDIEPEGYNLDPQKVEAAVTAKTRAIVPVHLFGQCCDMEPIWRIATQHDLEIVEDACQAIGAEYHGRRTGVLGSVGCFSFFPTKNLGGAGDGGMLTTDDAELATRLKRLRVHGDVGQYDHHEIGMNSRLDALQATVLRLKLRKLDQWTLSRQQNAKRYYELFREHELDDFLIAPKIQAKRRHVFNQFTVRIRNQGRDAVMKTLRERKVGCAVYYPKPLHVQTCFASLGYSVGDFPVAEAAANEVLSLPIYPELARADLERVVDELAHACQKHATAARTHRKAA